MTIRHWCAAAALCVASAGALAAPGPIDMSSGSASFENTVNGASGSSFTDTFTFTLLAPVTDFLGSLLTTKLGAKDIDFSSVALSGGTLVGSSAFTQQSSDPFELWGLSTGALGAGTYTLTVAGTKFGAAAVSYSGTLEVTPVPEPGTYALMLAGLGAIGFIARRRPWCLLS